MKKSRSFIHEAVDVDDKSDSRDRYRDFENDFHRYAVTEHVNKDRFRLYSLVVNSLEWHAVKFRALLRAEVLRLAWTFLDKGTEGSMLINYLWTRAVL